MGIFSPLTVEQKGIHAFPPSGILASGAANFEDTSQVESRRIYTTSTPLLNHNGLSFNQNTALSNAPLSRDLSINDFSIFNPYIHYISNPNGGKGLLDTVPYAFKIDTSSFYNLAVSGFNIYNTKYRPLS